MNNDFNTEDKKLWQEFSSTNSEGHTSHEVDENLIAAYLEGNTTEEEEDLIEQKMLNDPEFMTEIIELRQLIADAPLVLQEKIVHATTFTAILRELAAIAAIIVFFLGGYYMNTPTSELDDEDDSVFFAFDATDSMTNKYYSNTDGDL